MQQSEHVSMIISAKSNSAARPSKFVRVADNAGKRILIVDDEASIRALTRTFLEQVGYLVVSASSGKEALEKLSRDKIDLLVTDLSMPAMDGIELANRVCRQYPEVQIVVCSGYVDMSNDMMRIRARNWGFLSKPFRCQELIDLLSQRFEMN